MNNRFLLSGNYFVGATITNPNIQIVGQPSTGLTLSGVALLPYSIPTQLGLGTDSPSRQLHVKGPQTSGSTAGMMLENTDSSGTRWVIGEINDAGVLSFRNLDGTGAPTVLQLLKDGGIQLGNSSRMYSGSGAPSGISSATEGDFYFRTDGGAGSCIYQFRSGVWAATAA
jgi:hypothetical protein